MHDFKVLLVDDSEFIHRSFIEFLKKQDNVELHGIKEGLDALSVAKAYKPNIIFLDYILENTDGISVLKELKGNDATKNIPVLMISSKENHYDQQLAILHGADLFLQKPLKGDKIREKIRFYMSHTVRQKDSA